MKWYKLAAAGLITSLSITVHAQEEVLSVKDINTSTTSIEVDKPYEKPQLTRYTPEISLISSSFVGTGASNATVITKMAVGVNMDFGKGHLVIEGGALYKQIGSQESPTVNGVPAPVETDLSYISIPVAAKYYISNQHDSSFFGKAGAAPSLLLSNQGNTVGPNFRIIDPTAGELEAFVGLGGKFQMTDQIGIVLEVSYWRGLTPAYSGYDVFTSSFMSSLGVTIQM